MDEGGREAGKYEHAFEEVKSATEILNQEGLWRSPLFLIAFISLIVLFAQVRMFSVDATLKDLLVEVKRLRQIVEEQAAGPGWPEVGSDVDANPVDESAPEPAASSSASYLAPWQRGGK